MKNSQSLKSKVALVAGASSGLGRFQKIKARKEQARKYISDAIKLFEECEADVFLKQAKEELATLYFRL